jgi:fumarate reductase flavoprotein subunit
VTALRDQYDVVVVGAGSAGLPAAIAAADRGGRVCLIEGSDDVGGTLPLTRGWMSGAGTRRQAERGIVDTAQAHYEDVLRNSQGGADPAFVRLACALQGPLIDWLQDNGFEMAPDAPRAARGEGGYRIPRTYWGVDEGRSILKVLRPLLDAHVAAGRIGLMLNTKASTLATDGAAVIGVVADDGRRLLGHAVVLATGGYGSNPALFAQLHDGAVVGSGALPAAQGAGLAMGLGAGGVVAHSEKYICNFGGVLDHTLSPPRYRAPGGLTAEDRLPWEIVVDRQGQRFYAEDTHDAETRARALQARGGQAWVIYDAAIRQRAPSLFRYFSADKAERFYDADGPIFSADSLRQLAEHAGVDPVGLDRAVAAYNRAVDGQSDALGRRHLPRRIETAPFYALPIMAYTVRTTAGLKVDTEFHVLDAHDCPIPGLYAVGEVLGGLLPGMSLTSALAFGKYLGSQLYREAAA